MASRTKYVLFGIIGAGAMVLLVVLVIGAGVLPAETNVVKINSVAQNGVSEQLKGKWYRGEGSAYVDPTGKTEWGPGARFSYEFLGDGTVEYKTDRNAKSVMMCDIFEKKTSMGEYSISGDTMTVKFGETRFFSRDSCIEKDNFDKLLPRQTVMLKWKLKSEGEKMRLYIKDENGEFAYDKYDE